jgi:hypothetical protein
MARMGGNGPFFLHFLDLHRKNKKEEKRMKEMEEKKENR